MNFRAPFFAGLVASFGFACSSEPADGTPNDSDAGVTTCSGLDAPAALKISEGGRVVLARSGGLADSSLTFEGRGVTVTSSEGSITVRAPYMQEAESELSLDIRCGQGTTRVPVTLKALAWKKLSDSGSPAREYGAFWLDPEGGLMLFGGFHYEPKQFTPANDAWRFDFTTSAWTQLTGTNLPLLPGGRVAEIPRAQRMPMPRRRGCRARRSRSVTACWS